MKNWMRGVAAPVLVTVLLGLVSACNSVGKGNSINRVYINTKEAGLVEGATAPTNLTVYTCLMSPLYLIGEFDDGSAGNFSTSGRRTIWTSSDPSVVRVIATDDEVVNGRAYPAGWIVSQNVGTATISAQFLDLSASINIEVKESTDFKITPSELFLAPKSGRSFSVTSVQDGIRFVNQQGNFSFPTPNDGIATITASGTVLGVAASGTAIPVKVTLPGCSQELTASVNVVPVSTLTVQHETGFSGDLIQGFTETVRTIADLGGGHTQDLTGQVTLTSSNTAAASVSGSSVGAVAAGASNITASFGDPAVTSNSLPINVVTVTNLTDLVITPLNPTMKAQTSDLSVNSLAFTAIATFDGSRQQPVSVDVLNESNFWSTSDVLVAAIDAASGVASPLTFTGSGTTTVSRTYTFNGVTKTATTNLTVNPGAAAP